MRKSTLLAVLVVGTLLVPVAVFASHSFNDVPDDHTFHDAIAWMKDNGVTVGVPGRPTPTTAPKTT